MNVIQTNIKKVIEIIPTIHHDERGFFKEVLHPDKLNDCGISHRFVQLNHSKSLAGTIRGLHFQRPPYEQAKLVRVLVGTICDIAVDIRPSSPTYKQHVCVELSAEKHNMLYVPVGFAHGFYCVTDCEVEYACGDIYAPQFEGSIRWDDPEINIKWPNTIDIGLSEKDSKAPRLSEIEASLEWSKEAFG